MYGKSKAPCCSLISTNFKLSSSRSSPWWRDTVSQMAVGGRPGAKVGGQPCAASVG